MAAAAEPLLPAAAAATGAPVAEPAGQDRLVSQAIGIQAVIVNGTLIRENGADVISATDTMPGQILQGR